MAQLDKDLPVTLQELIISSLAQADALAKLLIEKGLIRREEFNGEDFRGTGDVSEAAESNAAINIVDILVWTTPTRQCESSARQPLADI